MLEGVTRALDLHLWPDLLNGQVEIRRGAAMAGGGCFRVELRGRSVHTARLHRGIDSITWVANLMTLQQRNVSRNIGPGTPCR